jgi:hypothetical protein
VKRIYNLGLVVVLGAVLALFFCGCTLNQNVSVPPGCEDSLIYRLVPNPQQAGILLRLGNLAAIDSDIYTPYQALAFIDECRRQLNMPNMTYAILAQFVGENLMPYLIIIGELVPQFAEYDIVINECDKSLLSKHLDQQEQIVRMKML